MGRGKKPLSYLARFEATNDSHAEILSESNIMREDRRFVFYPSEIQLLPCSLDSTEIYLDPSNARPAGRMTETRAAICRIESLLGDNA